MAALRGTIRADRSRVTRLSNRTLNVHADTWQTFAEVELHADGSGSVSVRQPSGELLRAEWSAETAELAHVEVRTVGDPGMAAGVLG